MIITTLTNVSHILTVSNFQVCSNDELDLWPFTQMADLEPHGSFVLWDDLSTEFLCPRYDSQVASCPSVRWQVTFGLLLRWLI